MKWISVLLAMGSLASTSNAFACGALAYNPNTQVWGRANGYNDLSDAMNAAINVCNDGCGVYAWTCSEAVAAIVFNGTSWATSTGATAAEAVANAQQSCPSCDGYVTTGE